MSRRLSTVESTRNGQAAERFLFTPHADSALLGSGSAGAMESFLHMGSSVEEEEEEDDDDDEGDDEDGNSNTDFHHLYEEDQHDHEFNSHEHEDDSQGIQLHAAGPSDQAPIAAGFGIFSDCGGGMEEDEDEDDGEIENDTGGEEPSMGEGKQMDEISTTTLSMPPSYPSYSPRVLSSSRTSSEASATASISHDLLSSSSYLQTGIALSAGSTAALTFRPGTHISQTTVPAAPQQISQRVLQPGHHLTASGLHSSASTAGSEEAAAEPVVSASKSRRQAAGSIGSDATQITHTTIESNLSFRSSTASTSSSNSIPADEADANHIIHDEG